MGLAEEKAEFNARAKASMQEYLRSKSWEEKVKSIERMNAAGRWRERLCGTALAKETT